jgi:hypothetical protein
LVALPTEPEINPAATLLVLLQQALAGGLPPLAEIETPRGDLRPGIL